MGVEALLSAQIIDTTTVGRAAMTAADAVMAKTVSVRRPVEYRVRQVRDEIEIVTRQDTQ